MRMRTIDEAFAFLKESDPDTAITKTALRRLVVSGEIHSVRIGSKYLVSLEALEAFLNGAPQKAAGPSGTGVIRRINVNS